MIHGMADSEDSPMRDPPVPPDPPDLPVPPVRGHVTHHPARPYLALAPVHLNLSWRPSHWPLAAAGGAGGGALT